MAEGSLEKISLHPALLAAKDYYTKVRHFECGRTKTVEKYVRPYDSEQPNVKGGVKAYRSRLDRLYNKNFIKPNLLLHLGHLSQDITLTLPEGEAWDKIRKNANRYGLSYKTMAREMLINLMLDGRCGVLVDGPAVAGRQTAAQAKKQRSWQVLFEAKDILYWDYFTDELLMGELRELVLRDKAVKRGGKTYQQVRRFVRDGDVVTFQVLESLDDVEKLTAYWNEEQQFKVTKEGKMGVNVIPFTFYGSGPEDSFFTMIVDLNDAHLNRGSVRSNVVYNQGFQRVVFFGVDEEEIKRIGEWLATVVKRSEGKVEVVPPGDTTAIETEIGSLEWFMMRAGKMEWNQLSDDTRQVQSADSKRLDTLGKQNFYNYVLDLLEDTLSSVYQFHALFEGANPEKITVRIERDYKLDDETEKAAKLNQAMNFAEKLGPDGFPVVKELVKVALAEIKFVPNDKETREEVHARLMKVIDAAKSPQESTGSGLAGVFDRLRAGAAAA